MRIVVVLLSSLLVACGSRAARPDAGRPESPPGTLTLVSQPAGAAVFRDQHIRLGRTPLTLQQPGGTQLSLTLVKDGYTPRQITAVFDSGRKVKLEATLTARKSEVVVNSEPIVGAEIFVDGVDEGRTPNRVLVDADAQHVVEVRKRGFETYRETVKLQPGKSQQISAVLLRQGSKVAMGILILRVDAPAKVYLDGRLVGAAPLPPLPLPLRPHQLRVVGLDGREARREVRLKKGQRLELVIELSGSTKRAKDR